MTPAEQISFGPFRLDPGQKQLWHGEQRVELRPQPLTVLHYLAERPGQLVTKDELLSQLWADRYVSQAVFKVCVRSIREALGDDATAPQYVETVGREGYRFIADISAGRSALSAQPSPQAPSSQRSAAPLIGREAELMSLRDRFERATQGERQLVFVTGEAGIGKTSLVDQFVAQLLDSERVWLGRGQCLEQHGDGEAYLPVLEALGRLQREPQGERIVEGLREHAPTWLVQLPALLSETDYNALQQKVTGATRERMLREMAEALETLSADRLLVLVFEDLHWSDVSTLELLAYLAQRREPAQLFVIGTYRPTDVILKEHPLRGIKQELQAKKQCEELALELLTQTQVGAYLATRLGPDEHVADLAQVIHGRTEGNALFMVNIVDHLTEQGVIVENGSNWQLHGTPEDVAQAIPDGMRQLIDKQLERLSPGQQQLLETASVAGVEFAAAAVAAGLKREIDDVEEVCEALVGQGHFLQETGIAEWPDGTLSGQYHFRHTLYQNVLSDRIASARQLRLHRTIGECLERGYAERTREIAAALAVHFEQGRDTLRAVQYLGQAGENANQRSAPQEAVHHLTKALDLLISLPDTTERRQQEFLLQTALGTSLILSKGFGTPEMSRVYSRARELCAQFSDVTQLFQATLGLWASTLVQEGPQAADQLGNQLMRLAESEQHPEILHRAKNAFGANLHFRGEYSTARLHLEQSIQFQDSDQDTDTSIFLPQEATVTSRCLLAFVLWTLGYPDLAQRRSQEAVTIAQEFGVPFILVMALSFDALIGLFRGEASHALSQAEKAMQLSQEYEFDLWTAVATIVQGWAWATQSKQAEGIAQLQHGLASWQTVGAKLARPVFTAFLAEIYHNTGQAKEGLAVVDEALGTIQQTGEHWYEAELHRLKGELLLKAERKTQNPERKRKPSKRKPQKAQSVHHSEEAEACFQRAIEIAHQQQAKAWELRSTMSLSRLWQQQGQQAKAYQLLHAIYVWFTEGAETADMKDAKALLAELRGSREEYPSKT